MNKNKIVFIGCGHMGSALLEGWVKYADGEKDDFVIVCRTDESVKTFKKQGFKAVAGICKLPKNINIAVAILAVRPDTIKDILPELKGRLSPSSIIVSVAAGKTINFMQKYLPGSQIIRAMPNLAVKEGVGVTSLFASKEVGQSSREYIFKAMSSLGIAFWLDKEEEIHRVIAFSGSSPAYMYSCALALQKAGEELGFNSELASEIAVNVFLGSALLFAKGEGSLQEAVSKIATKGGTTEAAVNDFRKNDALVKLFERAMKVCMAQSKKMSK